LLAGVGVAAVPEHVPTSSDYDLRNFTPVNGKVFFTAARSPVGRELWVTDGTQAGTHLVKDIYPGAASSSPVHLFNVGGTLYFFARDLHHGYELWKSDGTESGTVMVKDIYPGSGSSNNFTGETDSNISLSDVLTGPFVFTTNNPQPELWRSDGTAEGTYRLKEAGQIDDAYPYAQPRDLGPLWRSNGLTYFTGSDPDVGRELWVTDGTVAGTKVLKDIRPGKEWSGPGSVTEGAGGITYFTAITGGGGIAAEPIYSMFRTDGTEAGTQPILEGPHHLGTEPVTEGIQYARSVPLGGFTYFIPSFPHQQPTQVWRTDGTPGGTVKVIEFPKPNSDFVNVASVNLGGVFRGQLLLYAYTPETGWEFWLSDGTQAGTHPLLENPGPADTGLFWVEPVNDRLYFYKSTPATGFEPYSSDGTPEGTVLLKDIVPGPTSSGTYNRSPFQPVAGGKVVFPAQSREPVTVPNPWTGPTTYYMHDLFVTDGTPAGTVKLETIPPTPPPSTVVARHVYYNNSVFDGNADGTADVAAIATDKQALLPRQSSSFANVTSYNKGINGIMVDVRGLSPDANLTADDFVIRSGAGPSASDLAAGPSSPAVAVWRGKGDGGSDRVTLVWPEGAVKNKWVEVTVKANDHTGLAAPDVFYFGNLVGETGDSLTPTKVSSADLAGVKRVLNTNAGPDSRYDINRDGKVNALDLGIVRAALFQQLAPIAVPILGATAPAAMETATSMLREG
jgi:ELWxxDGT repeat protein